MRLEQSLHLRQARVQCFREAVRPLLLSWRIASAVLIVGGGTLAVMVHNRIKDGRLNPLDWADILGRLLLIALSMWWILWVIAPWLLAWSDQAAEIRDGLIHLERFNRRIRPRDILDCRIEPSEHRPGAYHFSIVYRDFLGRAEWWSIVVDNSREAERFRAKILEMKKEAVMSG